MPRNQPKHAGPADLARAVEHALTVRGSKSPPPTDLAELFHTLIAVSYSTEEREPIRVQVCWIDPNDPDPDRPLRARDDRWQWIPFPVPMSLTTATLTKLAQASDPRSTAIGVYSRRGKLSIHGVVDQQLLMHNFLFREGDRVYPGPGAFQARVEGVAHIRVYDGYVKIAELRSDELVGPSIDAFSRGPVADRLAPGIDRHLDKVWEQLTELPDFARRFWRGPVRDNWLSALSRTLLRAEGYRLGGAFIVTPDASLEGLNIKYPLSYSRLADALIRRATHLIQMDEAYDYINFEYLIPEEEEMQVIDWLDYDIERDSLEDSIGELDGTTRFISLLTRVDGAVVLSSDLTVLGFGAEITHDQAPDAVAIARDRTGSSRRLRPGDYNHYGTRHRSMMRYCWSIPGSVGFVASHDGGVRAITRHNDRVVMWQDIQLQHEWDYSRKTRRRSRKLLLDELPANQTREGS